MHQGNEGEGVNDRPSRFSEQRQLLECCNWVRHMIDYFRPKSSIELPTYRDFQNIAHKVVIAIGPGSRAKAWGGSLRIKSLEIVRKVLISQLF